MFAKELIQVIYRIFFAMLALQPTVALSVRDIATLCQNWTSIKDREIFSNFESHSMSVDFQLNVSIIRLFVPDEFQNVLFNVYVSSSRMDMALILLHLGHGMNWDENVTPQREERRIYVVCVSQGIFKAQGDCSENFPGVRVPAYEEVYLVSFRSESEHLNGTAQVQDWFELYSLEDCLMVKRLERFHNMRSLNVDNIDTTELLRLSFRRDNLHLRPVRVVAQKAAGYEKSFDVDIINGSTVFNGGTQYKMSLDYQFMLNFTYIPVFGMGFPRILSRNGTSLNGIGEQLADKDADFTGISITYIELRAQKLSYMPAVAFAEYGVFYRGRSAHMSNRELLLLPFEMKTWLVSGLAFLALLLASAVIGYVVGNFHMRNTSAGGVSMWVVGVLLSQGGNSIPATLPIQTIVFTAALTSSLLYNAYTGAFVASVSSPLSAPKNIDAFKKLGFTVFTDPNVLRYAEDFIKDSGDKLQLERNSRKLYKGMNSLVERVLDPTKRLASAYRKDGFYGTALALNLSPWKFCEISVTPANRESRRKESFLVRKGWPYRELFAQKTVILIERGLGHLYFNTFLRQTQPPCVLTWMYDINISLVQCSGAFGVLIFGACVALVGLYMERLYLRISVMRT